jgi:hypothetical protein
MRYWRMVLAAACLVVPLTIVGCQEEPADTGDTGVTETKEAPEKPASEKPPEGEQKQS